MRDWLQEARDIIAVERHPRVALLYSGGIESSLLLHLAAPWRSSVTVYTVRTGAEFPHMIEFIDRKLAEWPHRIVPVDLAASLVSFGLPSYAVPIEHMPGVAEAANINERLPRIVPAPFCCSRNRAVPGYEAVIADGIGAALHGQRAGDYPRPAATPLAHPGLELIAPLWAMPRAAVVDAVSALGIELPPHYAEYPSSLDCSICPSALTTRRREWMARHYPKHLLRAESLHATVRGGRGCRVGR